MWESIALLWRSEWVYFCPLRGLWPEHGRVGTLYGLGMAFWDGSITQQYGFMVGDNWRDTIDPGVQWFQVALSGAFPEQVALFGARG